MISHKLYARSRLYASARTPRNWRSSFAFFVPFRRHFNDKQLANVLFGSSAEVCIQQKSALGSNDLSTLPALKTEVEIFFGGCARPSCPSRVTPLKRIHIRLAMRVKAREKRRRGGTEGDRQTQSVTKLCTMAGITDILASNGTKVFQLFSCAEFGLLASTHKLELPVVEDPGP